MIEVHDLPSLPSQTATYTPLINGTKGSPQANKIVVLYQSRAGNTKNNIEPNTWGIIHKCLVSKKQIENPKQNEVLTIDGTNYRIVYPPIDRNQALGIAPHWECQLKTI